MNWIWVVPHNLCPVYNYKCHTMIKNDKFERPMEKQKPSSINEGFSGVGVDRFELPTSAL